MRQLKMYWLKGTEIQKYDLPEGYTITTYKDESDKEGWLKCCQNGRLLSDENNVNLFDVCITGFPHINLETDVFFIDHEGEHVGTTTAVYNPEENIGLVHMVGIRTEYRGKGLGKFLCTAALEKLNAQGVKYIRLTTDDWRLGAVKSYLNAGFLPVDYDDDMKFRWELLLETFKIDSVDMLNDDATFKMKVGRPKKVKIGVVGVGRGRTMMNYCNSSNNAELVAICDNYLPLLEKAKKEYETVTFYDNFDEFINHDMDVVVLANYATEHAPMAIRCLDKGLHVISEVLPVQTMKEAVELVEAVERSGKYYLYAENNCYMPAARKMRELVEQGVLGKFEYGEGEYMHNCEPIWTEITRGDPDHWRNNMSAFYYCTHSAGPLVHISQKRPVKVSGFELPFNDRMARMGAKAGAFAMEVITFEDGSIAKSLHGVGPSKNSTWYSIYGSKGRMESAREDADKDYVKVLYVNCDKEEGDNKSESVRVSTHDNISDFAKDSGHGGADYYMMYHFIETIRGRKGMDYIDVYEAMDMFFPGMFGYCSAMQGGIPVEIPNFRNPEEREKYRNDTECTDPKVAGDMLIPSYSKGNPDIPAEVYEGYAKRWEEMLAEQEEKESENYYKKNT